MKFYLGTPEPAWLDRVDFPLFVSRRRLARRRTQRPATCDYAIDSGGFTELDRFGRWTVSTHHFAQEIAGYCDEIGTPDFAAPMDRMCEPFILRRVEQETGRLPTVREHQELTVANLLELRAIAPDVPWAPVVQGWEPDDYLACVELYAAAGVDLTAEPVVGVGSVCRRQGTRDAHRIITMLAALGLRMHAFGVKKDGLELYADEVESADSQAWSARARRLHNEQRAADGTAYPLTIDCRHRRGSPVCTFCPAWARQWRDRLLADVAAASPQKVLAL